MDRSDRRVSSTTNPAVVWSRPQLPDRVLPDRVLVGSAGGGLGVTTLRGTAAALWVVLDEPACPDEAARSVDQLLGVAVSHDDVARSYDAIKALGRATGDL